MQDSINNSSSDYDTYCPNQFIMALRLANNFAKLALTEVRFGC